MREDEEAFPFWGFVDLDLLTRIACFRPAIFDWKTGGTDAYSPQLLAPDDCLVCHKGVDGVSRCRCAREGTSAHE